MGSMWNSEVGRSMEQSGPTSSVTKELTHHCETTVNVDASPSEAFALLDDHRRLSAHMSKRSWMMAGSRMSIDMDDARGQAAGSRIRLSGTVLGLKLWVDEIVTERIPPMRKVWETTVPPRLLIIGSYQMGYSIERQGPHSRLVVFIDYALPEGFFCHWLGLMFGRFYAQWCTSRMANDAAAHFAAR